MQQHSGSLLFTTALIKKTEKKIRIGFQKVGIQGHIVAEWLAPVRSLLLLYGVLPV